MNRAGPVALLLSCLACSGETGPKPDDPYLTVFVSSDGRMEVNGNEVALFQLEEALQAASANGAVVLFARETPERDRAPISRHVMQLLSDRKIPMRVCRERDFSDALTPEGKLRPW